MKNTKELESFLKIQYQSNEVKLTLVSRTNTKDHSDTTPVLKQLSFQSHQLLFSQCHVHPEQESF